MHCQERSSSLPFSALNLKPQLNIYFGTTCDIKRFVHRLNPSVLNRFQLMAFECSLSRFFVNAAAFEAVEAPVNKALKCVDCKHCTGRILFLKYQQTSIEPGQQSRHGPKYSKSYCSIEQMGKLSCCLYPGILCCGPNMVQCPAQRLL